MFCYNPNGEVNLVTKSAQHRAVAELKYLLVSNLNFTWRYTRQALNRYCCKHIKNL